MKPYTLTVVILSCCVLGGCATWPSKGKGGIAEHRLESVSPSWRKQTYIPNDGLRFELELLSRHLDVLMLEGAELCFPSTVVQAKQLEARAVRELEGGLPHDASNDIHILRKLLYRLERQLDYVLGQEVCLLPASSKQKTPSDIGSKLHELLNTDNQFAFGSAEITPKYIGRLAEAAKLLQEFTSFNLRVTGHTDAIGTPETNLTLSKERASKVARYLSVFGVSSARLIIDGAGSSKPYFAGMSPEVRLNNRRVSVEIIETTQAASLVRDEK